MSVILAVLGSLGGITAFITGTFFVVRGLFAQASATRTNTVAVNKLTEEIEKLDDRLDTHAERIAKLEGHNARRG